MPISKDILVILGFNPSRFHIGKAGEIEEHCSDSFYPDKRQRISIRGGKKFNPDPDGTRLNQGNGTRDDKF